MKYLALIVLMFGTMACTADIRPDQLKDKLKPDKHDATRGRALLQQAAQAHGVDTFNKVATYEMTLEDRWVGVMGKMGNPWPEDIVRVKLAYRARSFDGRATFLNTDHKGTVWGMQSWKTYEIRPKQTRPTFTDNDDARFILPAIQYLTEFIFRDHSKNVVSYAGSETLHGTKYERVFITWSSLEPSDKHDQYMIYINPKTKRVEKIFYTVRDFMDMATGAIHFEDMRNVNGVWFPFKQSVTTDVSDKPSEFMHRITLKQVTINAPTVDTFEVNAKLRAMGDEK